MPRLRYRQAPAHKTQTEAAPKMARLCQHRLVGKKIGGFQPERLLRKRKNLFSNYFISYLKLLK